MKTITTMRRSVPRRPSKYERKVSLLFVDRDDNVFLVEEIKLFSPFLDEKVRFTAIKTKGLSSRHRLGRYEALRDLLSSNLLCFWWVLSRRKLLVEERVEHVHDWSNLFVVRSLLILSFDVDHSFPVSRNTRTRSVNERGGRSERDCLLESILDQRIIEELFIVQTFLVTPSHRNCSGFSNRILEDPKNRREKEVSLQSPEQEMTERR